MVKNLTVICSLLILLLSLAGCTVKYSLSGASIPAEVKTVSILYLHNNAQLVQPSLSQLLTEALKDRFLSETNLTLVEQDGDFNFEGSITNYVVTPVAIQGNETAALNRLTVTVSISFTNSVDTKQSYQTQFSRYEDYDSSQDLSAVENDLINSINDQLVIDIFNKAVINW